MNPSWLNVVLSSLLFIVYVAASCIGLFLIKSAESWRTPLFCFGFFLYALGALIWMVILRMTPLSVAFPVAAGALMVGTVVTGIFFLGENFGVWQFAGALMIISGIVLIAINR